MTHIVEKPLFPGYLFVGWQQPESWSPIKAAPGVKSLVGTNGKPGMVRQGTVEALQAGDDARRTPTPPGALWAAGDPCQPSHGPFRGLPAAVMGMDGEIATIAVMMLGQLRRIQIPVEHLSLRDED
jgi:transcription antitermination factor NusG